MSEWINQYIHQLLGGSLSDQKIREPTLLSKLCEEFLGKVSQEDQVAVLDKVLKIIQKHTSNADICVREGLIAQILNFLASFGLVQGGSPRMIVRRVLQLLLYIARHTVSVHDVQHMFELFQHPNLKQYGIDDDHMSLYVATLELIGRSSYGPGTYFDLSGKNSGIVVPELRSFPASGYTFAAWIRMESFESMQYKPVCVFWGPQGVGISVYFEGSTLVIETSDPRSKTKDTTAARFENIIESGKWQWLCIAHSHRQIRGSKVEVYVSGKLKSSTKLVYPNVNGMNPVTQAYIGMSPLSKNRSASYLQAQIGPVALFSQALTGPVIQEIRTLAGFDARVINASMIDVRTSSATSSSGHYNSSVDHIIFAYDARNCDRFKGICFDITPNKNHGDAAGSGLSLRVTSTFKECIWQLGGPIICLPLLVSFPRGENDIFLQSPPSILLSQPLGPSSIVKVMALISEIMRFSTVNRFCFRRKDGFRLMALLIRLLEPHYLTHDLLISIEKYSSIIAYDATLTADLKTFLLFNLEIWVNAKVELQDMIFDKIEEEVHQHKEKKSLACISIRSLCRALSWLYWVEFHPNAYQRTTIFTDKELIHLRSRVMTAVRLQLLHASKPHEFHSEHLQQLVEYTLQYIITGEDLNDEIDDVDSTQLIEILNLLIGFLQEGNKLSLNLIVHLEAFGGIRTWITLLGTPQVQVRILCLKFFRHYLHLQRLHSNVLLDERNANLILAMLPSKSQSGPTQRELICLLIGVIEPEKAVPASAEDVIFPDEILNGQAEIVQPAFLRPFLKYSSKAAPAIRMITLQLLPQLFLPENECNAVNRDILNECSDWTLFISSFGANLAMDCDSEDEYHDASLAGLSDQPNEVLLDLVSQKDQSLEVRKNAAFCICARAQQQPNQQNGNAVNANGTAQLLQLFAAQKTQYQDFPFSFQLTLLPLLHKYASESFSQYLQSEALNFIVKLLRLEFFEHDNAWIAIQDPLMMMEHYPEMGANDHSSTTRISMAFRLFQRLFLELNTAITANVQGSLVRNSFIFENIQHSSNIAASLILHYDHDSSRVSHDALIDSTSGIPGVNQYIQTKVNLDRSKVEIELSSVILSVLYRFIPLLQTDLDASFGLTSTSYRHAAPLSSSSSPVHVSSRRPERPPHPGGLMRQTLQLILRMCWLVIYSVEPHVVQVEPVMNHDPSIIATAQAQFQMYLENLKHVVKKMRLGQDVLLQDAGFVRPQGKFIVSNPDVRASPGPETILLVWFLDELSKLMPIVRQYHWIENSQTLAQLIGMFFVAPITSMDQLNQMLNQDDFRINQEEILRRDNFYKEQIETTRERRTTQAMKREVEENSDTILQKKRSASDAIPELKWLKTIKARDEDYMYKLRYLLESMKKFPGVWNRHGSSSAAMNKYKLDQYCSTKNIKNRLVLEIDDNVQSRIWENFKQQDRPSHQYNLSPLSKPISLLDSENISSPVESFLVSAKNCNIIESGESQAYDEDEDDDEEDDNEDDDSEEEGEEEELQIHVKNHEDIGKNIGAMLTAHDEDSSDDPLHLNLPSYIRPRLKTNDQDSNDLNKAKPENESYGDITEKDTMSYASTPAPLLSASSSLFSKSGSRLLKKGLSRFRPDKNTPEDIKDSKPSTLPEDSLELPSSDKGITSSKPSLNLKAISSSVTSVLKNEKKSSSNLLYKTKGQLVLPAAVVKGLIRIGKMGIVFEGLEIVDYHHSTSVHTSGDETRSQSGAFQLLRRRTWGVRVICAIYLRHHLCRSTGLEIYFIDGTSCCFVFESRKEVAHIFQLLKSQNPPCLGNHVMSHQKKNKSSMKGKKLVLAPEKALKRTDYTSQWIRRELSNFDYLMILNTMAGRTYSDLTQYPVFPWILQDYTSECLDLENPDTYRDLSKPMGALDATRWSSIAQQYESRKEQAESDTPAFHYSSFYSNVEIVLQYLIRLSPFTEMYVSKKAQEQRQSSSLSPAPMFHSVGQTFQRCLQDPNMFMELIPEFYFSPEFLRHDDPSSPLSNVSLPPWAQESPEKFIQLHRQALESDHVSQHLHLWIDLIFGHKQRGAAAATAQNLYYYLAYDDCIDFRNKDPMIHERLLRQIRQFGQVPFQLFREAGHPARMTKDEALASLYPEAHQVAMLSSRRQVRRQEVMSHQHEVAIAVVTFVPYLSLAYSIDEAGFVAAHTYKSQTPDAKGFPFTISPFSGGSGVSSTSSSSSSSSSKKLKAAWHLPTGCHPKYATLYYEHLISCGYYDGSWRITWAGDGEPIQRVPFHKKRITTSSYSEDYTTGDMAMAFGSEDCTISVWALSKYSATRTKNRMTSSFSRHHLPVGSLPWILLTGHSDAVACVALNVDLDIIISSSISNQILIHELRQARVLHSIQLPISHADFSIATIIVSTIGDFIVHALEKNQTSILFLYSMNGRLIYAHRIAGEVERAERLLPSMFFSKSGRYLITASMGESGGIDIREVHHECHVHRRVESQPPTCLTSIGLSHDERCVLAGYEDGSIMAHALHFGLEVSKAAENAKLILAQAAAAAQLKHHVGAKTPTIVLHVAKKHHHGHFRAKSSLLPAPEIMDCLQSLHREIRHVCVSGEAQYEALLVQLWNAVYPEEALVGFVRQGQAWTALGFQRPDPTTDFRAGGILSLRCLVFFAQQYPNEMTTMIQSQIPGSHVNTYPLAPTGINVTCKLASFLWNAQGELNLDYAHLWPLLLEPRAFFELFSEALRIFDFLWREMNAQYHTFSYVMQSMEHEMQFLFESDCTSIASIQDMGLHRRMEYCKQLGKAFHSPEVPAEKKAPVAEVSNISGGIDVLDHRPSSLLPSPAVVVDVAPTTDPFDVFNDIPSSHVSVESERVAPKNPPSTYDPFDGLFN